MLPDPKNTPFLISWAIAQVSCSPTHSVSHWYVWGYVLLKSGIARVFRRDSPPTRSRGGESSSMLTSAEGNAVQAFSMLL
jgi:hypothetical protein